VRRCECLDLLALASIHSHLLPPQVSDLSSPTPAHRFPDPWPRVVSGGFSCMSMILLLCVVRLRRDPFASSRDLPASVASVQEEDSGLFALQRSLRLALGLSCYS
jgi:hypothetical protein